MRSLFRAAALAMVMAAATAWPQQTPEKKPTPPADPCPLATTDIARTTCWEEQASKADASLTALYRQIRTAIRAHMAEDTGSLKGYRERALEKLTAAQQAWDHYRDAQCDAAEQQNEGGTIAPAVHASCLKDLSDRRADELRKTYAIYLR